jgi:RND family efflux transporter MFP subunit
MRYLSLILVALGFGVAAAGCRGKNGDGPGGKGANGGGPEVFYTYPTSDTVIDYEDFSGRTEAIASVEVRSQASGYLMKVLFKDGALVNKDQPLFQIDDRLPKAELEKADASFKQATVRLERLERDFARANRLKNQNAISDEEYDKIWGDHEEAKAAVGVAKAARDLAQQNLDYTLVTAPVAGRISYRMKDPGNYVKAGDTLLTTVVSYDPMYVYFEIDERTALRLQRLRAEGKIRYEKDGSVTFDFHLADEEGFQSPGDKKDGAKKPSDDPRRGVINFFDNRLDAGTGTLRLRGEFKNPDVAPDQFTRVCLLVGDRYASLSIPALGFNNPKQIAPGLFARVRLWVGMPHPALLIPERAINTDQGKKFVYVIDESNKAIRRYITVGALREDMRIVEPASYKVSGELIEGLLGNERVAVDGLQRIRDNTVVNAKDEKTRNNKD